jgi:TIR domain
MTADEFEFDVFISYSRKDRDWVDRNLIPKLTSFKVSYAIDYKDFVGGRSTNAEMLRLITSSRHTVAVVTRNWTLSSFTDFELQLSKAIDPKARAMRLVPLLIEDCELPALLKAVAPIRCVPGNENAAWRKIHEVLVETKAAVEPRSHALDVEMELWKRAEDRGGYGYEGTVTVYNPIPVGPAILFDSVIMHATTGSRIPHAADAVRFWFTADGRFITEFSYDGPLGFGHFQQLTQEDHPEPITMEAGRGMRVPNVHFGSLRPSVAGKEITLLSVSLYLGRTPVTAPCYAVMPPVVRLPMDLSRDPKNGYRLRFIKDDCASAPSGILDEDLLDNIFQTAANHSPDSLLMRITPELLTVVHFSGGEHLHCAKNWHYQFFSEAKRTTFYIASMDPTWVQAGGRAEGRPELWLNESILRSCKVDATAAYLIVLEAGTRAEEEPKGTLLLQPVRFDDRWRPLWRTPRTMESEDACVLADSGEVIIRKNGTFLKARNIIWNT